MKTPPAPLISFSEFFNRFNIDYYMIRYYLGNFYNFLNYELKWCVAKTAGELGVKMLSWTLINNTDNIFYLLKFSY